MGETDWRSAGGEDQPLIVKDAALGKPTKPPAQYSFFVACAFLVNYALGVGMLGTPYAFYKAGLVLGVVFMVGITAVGIVTAMWIVEASVRANALASAAAEEESAVVSIIDSVSTVNSINTPTSEWARSDSNAQAPSYSLTTQFENNELCYMFLGLPGKLFYEVCMVAYLFGTLWLYGVVASSSLTTYVPIVNLTTGITCEMNHSGIPDECQYAYWIWIAIVAFFVIPASCLDLTDQIILQVTMSVFRFVATGIICVSTVVAMIQHPIVPEITGPPYFAFTGLADIKGFGMILTTSIFAQLIHYGVPSIVQPVKNKDKLLHVFTVGCSVTMLVYLAIGLICALYFGSHAEQVITLNWTHWNGNFYTSSGFDKELWATIISYVVILFPVATTTTGFPLLAINLGNNLYAGLPSTWTDNMQCKRVKILCRLLAAIPPLIGAVCLRDVALLIELTGLSGFFIGYIIPGFLQHYSAKACEEKWGELGKRTPYTWHFSHPFYVWSIVSLVFLAFLYTAVMLVLDLASVHVF